MVDRETIRWRLAVLRDAPADLRRYRIAATLAHELPDLELFAVTATGWS